MNLTHFDERGNAIMADVGAKDETEREAVASGKIRMSAECFDAVRTGAAKKGDVLGAARLAGIMAAKKTPDLIPLCHQVRLTKVSVDFEPVEESCEIKAVCTARAKDRTGVEMEALTAVSVALLTIYDMCKAIDKSMEISEILLLQKSGGKSGEFRRKI